MTEELSIPECIEVVSECLLDTVWLLQRHNREDPDSVPGFVEASACLEIIKEHCERVDACHYAGPPEGAPFSTLSCQRRQK